VLPPVSNDNVKLRENWMKPVIKPAIIISNLLSQMHCEMEAQVKKLHEDQDDIMRGFKESQKNIAEAGPEADTVYSTQIEML
jgi:hypothetical protein